MSIPEGTLAYGVVNGVESVDDGSIKELKMVDWQMLHQQF